MADYDAGNVIIGVSSLSIDGTSVGYTSGGVSIIANMERTLKEVDQSYAPVGLHKIRESFEVRTSLAEATLENLKIAWEQSASVDVGVGTKTLSWGINSTPVEHTLIFVGAAPDDEQRTFTVYRAYVWESGEMPYKRDEVTIIPITFKVFPNTTYGAGKEYGYVVDGTA